MPASERRRAPKDAIARTNVGTSLGPIIGREADVAALSTMLDGGTRLVTLAGLAGIGKSTVAAEVARRFVAGHERAAFVCALADAADPSAVTDAIAAATEMSAEAAGPEAGRRVARALDARGEVLLVLDDAEMVAGALEPLLTTLLSNTRALCVLVTSRIRTGHPSESIYELGPLALPTAREVDRDAVKLFLARAKMARHDYELRDEDAPIVCDIVRLLDGNPLALELVAPRLATLSARALFHRLQTRVEPVARARAASKRHASLDAAIEASIRSLEPDVQDVLAQCAIFRGTFDLEAIEEVVRASGSIATAVEELQHASLLRGREVEGELGLSLYESVRRVASARLDESGKREEVAGRHAAFYVKRAESLVSSALPLASRRAALLRDRDNLFAIVERVLSGAPATVRTAEPALRALIALAPVLFSRGPLARYAALLDPVLEATAGSGADPTLTASALALRGRLRRHIGRAKEGAKDLVLAAGLAERLGMTALEADVAYELGCLLLDRGEAENALSAWERAGDRARACGSRVLEGRIAAKRALCRPSLGIEDRTIELERALSLLASTADTAATFDARIALAELRLDAGADDEAERHLEQVLSEAIELGDDHAAARARRTLGLLALAHGEIEVAETAFGLAEESFGALAYRVDASITSGYLGIVDRMRGLHAAAYARITESASFAFDGTHDDVLAVLLTHRAALETDVGRAPIGLRLLEELSSTSPRPPADEVVALELARAAGRPLPPMGRAAHSRIAARCIEGGRAPTLVPDDVLLVSAGGEWFRAPHGARVSLTRRPTLSRLLDALAVHRIAAPGERLAWDALLAAAWPGERVIADAGAHRVRVAISTLRKLGLKDVLETLEDGYRLAPAIELRR